MSEEVEVYVGRTAVPSAGYLGWQGYSDTVFSESDFFCRPRKSTHRVVKKVIDQYYDEPPDVYRYFFARASTVRQRLLIQGYTPAFCQQAWDYARRHQVETYRQFSIKDDGEVARGVDLLESLTFEEWRRLVRAQVMASPGRVLEGRHQPWHFMSLLEAPNDVFVQLALLADALPSSPVWMECNFIYEHGDDPRTPQQVAREEQAEFADFPEGKIIVLTEGKSDSRIITSALQTLYPELADAYQFLDFEEFRIEGGASLLARMIKTLAGARVRNRMLALFDNDAAGVEALKTVNGVRFPRNVKLMTLPDTKFAQNYPTIGPNGLARMDVNGAGASIELYLGRSSLTGPNGKLRPIRWSHWNGNVSRYQGVIEDKEAVGAAFEKSLANGKSAPALRRAFPEMDLLLQMIFQAFEDVQPPII
jgi:hypothetical protein